MKNRCALLIPTLLVLNACGPNLDDLGNSLGNLNKELTTLNITLSGGYTLEEVQGCQKETRQAKNIELDSKAKVNIYMRPGFFSLYTEEHAYTDTQDPTFYEIRENKFKNYNQKFLGDWISQDALKIPFENQALIFNPNPPARAKTPLTYKNPFSIASYRIGVRKNFLEQIFRERYEGIELNDEDLRTVFCAAALNAYYGALISTNYSFAE